MSKRKIMLLAMSIIMVAILAVGGTLAYFTSEDEAENVFTLGNVEIDLVEVFEQESDLQPGVEVEKQVWIENTGSKEAYVRAHIAIPTNLDAQDPTKSGKEVWKYLHFINTEAAGVLSWDDENGDINFYTATLESESGEDVAYNVYVVTYLKPLQPDMTTANAIDGVYLDTGVDAEAVYDADDKLTAYTYIDVNGHEVTLPIEIVDEELAKISIKVYAEGVQTATFENAYDALNTAFGTPGATDYVAPWNK